VLDKARLFFAYQRDYLRAVYGRIDPELAELIPLLMALLIGAWLLLPFESFRQEPGVTPFSPFLRAIGLPTTEPLVGGCFLIYGLVGYLALSLGWGRARLAVSGFGSSFWLWATLALLIRNPVGLLWMFVLPFFLCSLYAFMRGPTFRKRRGFLP